MRVKKALLATLMLGQWWAGACSPDFEGMLVRQRPWRELIVPIRYSSSAAETIQAVIEGTFVEAYPNSTRMSEESEKYCAAGNFSGFTKTTSIRPKCEIVDTDIDRVVAVLKTSFDGDLKNFGSQYRYDFTDSTVWNGNSVQLIPIGTRTLLVWQQKAARTDAIRLAEYVGYINRITITLRRTIDHKLYWSSCDQLGLDKNQSLLKVADCFTAANEAQEFYGFIIFVKASPLNDSMKTDGWYALESPTLCGPLFTPISDADANAIRGKK